MIDDPVLLAFCNETLRPVGDRLAGLLPLPQAVIDTIAGKGLSAVLGTTDAKLFRSEPWELADYGEIAPAVIAGADSAGRTAITNYDVIALVRVLVTLRLMSAANDQLGPLVAKWGVNPRA